MLRFTQKFGRDPWAKLVRARRQRSFHASLEVVEDRKLLSTLTTISWDSGKVVNSEVFGIGDNNTVSMSKNGGSFVSLSGYLKSISAGLDAAGNPEVYGIGGDNGVWVDDNGTGWTDRSGYVKAIAASVDNTIFAIGGDNAVYINRGGTGWLDLGGNFTAISSGLDAYGNPEVYGINTNGTVSSNDNGLGWVARSGYVKAISGSVNNTVFAIGGDNAVYVNRGGTGWVDQGGNVLAISAGLDTVGNPEIYGIGTNNGAFVNDNGKGWVNLGGYVTEIAATSNSKLYARGEDVDSVFASSNGAGFGYVGDIPLADPAADTAYSPAPSGVSLFNNNQPSYLDVQQGQVGDCWLEASLAEVAARDPQDIKNMFTYDGTTVDNGSVVGLYQVRFYNSNGSAFYVKVDTDLPSGGEYYDHVDNALGTKSLWVALAEKGYAEANTYGLVTTHAEYEGSYDAMGGGDPSYALQAITGKPVSDYNINPTNIASAWNSGQLIVMCTGTPTSSYIVGDHCYAVVGYNASSSQPFQVFNPWGTQSNGYAPNTNNTIYGLFTANATFISQNFDEQSIGTGAINEDHGVEQFDEFTRLTTLMGNYDPSESMEAGATSLMHAKARSQH